MSHCDSKKYLLRFFPYLTHYHPPPHYFLHLHRPTHTLIHKSSVTVAHVTCHITHHTHSHHSLHHHDIIHDSHSLSMTSSKIQTQPTSNSIINRDLISNHPYLLSRSLSDLTHINSGDSHSTWKHINTPFLHSSPISPFLTFRVTPFFLFSFPYIFPQWFILRCTPFHPHSVLHMLSSFPLHLSFYSFIAYISLSALIQFH
jgi:hypothetical protein